jgi:hypothetical protein
MGPKPTEIAMAQVPSQPAPIASSAPNAPALPTAIPMQAAAAIPAPAPVATPAAIPPSSTEIAPDAASLPSASAAANPPFKPEVQPGFESLPVVQPAVQNVRQNAGQPATQASAIEAGNPAPVAMPSISPATVQIMPDAAASVATPPPAETTPAEIASGMTSNATPDIVAPAPAPAPIAPVLPDPAINPLDAIAGSILVPDSELSRPNDAVDLQTMERIATEKRAAAREAARIATEKAKAAKVKADKDAAAAAINEKAKHPPRFWVQVATGSDARALGSDFRRLASKYPALFKGKKGAMAVWNKSRRLLVGPFATAKDAKSFDADLRKAGTSGFVWNSDAGEVVEPLPAK